ncbi:nuclear RNA export factor 3 isoform X3 [Gorilla gorilla gorilla]|uniref:nuclear RNA export factor 3 isoform X3 n=1 Tax=Gorilla gorilla gorilla TaxID=9595 RepID=UPI002445623C|nr:nuclear RNA export factor 3 isoform X2 [Gorilla gorilla gorilla]
MSLPSGHTMGHTDQVVQRRARSWDIYQRRFSSRSEPVNPGMHSSPHQQQDGDAAMHGAHMDSPVRYTPYAISPYNRKGSFRKQDQTHVNMEREQKPPERRMEGNMPDGTLGSWFKITVPFGIKYNEKWLLNLIQNECSVPFVPVEISIFVNPAGIRHFVHRELKSEKVEQIKLAMNQQCDVSQEALDLQRLPFYPDMVNRDTKMASNPRKCMAASLDVHEENIPTVMSAGEMDKWKGIEPGEKCADRSPVCTTFSDTSSNRNSILELFPKLLCLDGQQSPRATLCGTEAHKRLPTCKGSFFGSEMLKNLVLQFLQQYYLIYDSGDRQGLLSAYHDEACFSLSIPFNPEDSAPSSLCKFFKDSRNIKIIKDPYLRGELLKHTKLDIVDSLSALPKTQHDLSSFLVDMWYQTEWMLCFSVNGVFKEVEGQSQGSVLAFTRTFIATPGSSSSLCIVNDKLFVRDTSHQGTQSALFTLVPTAFSSSMPAFSQEQQKMVQVFSAQSGMNYQLPQNCLRNNQCDYVRAPHVLAWPKMYFPVTEPGDLAGAKKPKPNSQD